MRPAPNPGFLASLLTAEEQAAAPTLMQHAETVRNPAAYKALPLAVQKKIRKEFMQIHEQNLVGAGEWAREQRATRPPPSLKHWPLHKAMCKTLIKQQNLLETHSLHQPGGIASAATMAAFTRAGQAEVDVAAYASLKLTGPNPIHTTHAFYIFLRPVPYEEDASVAFEVVAALVMPHLEIEKLVNYPGAPVTIGAKSLPISISDQLSQDGLNNFMGLRDGIPGFRTATVWQAHMVDGTWATSIDAVILPALDEATFNRGLRAWRALEDVDWLSNLRARLKVSTKPMASGRSSRAVARLTGAY